MKRLAVRSVLSALALTLASVPAHAATILWDGGTTGGGTAWLITTNWAGDVIPGAADAAVFTNTGSAGTIGINLSQSPGGTQEVGMVAQIGTTARTIENSSATADGFLQLNGVGGMLISNSSPTAQLTFRNGTAGRTMGIILASSGQMFVSNAAAPVVISNSVITEINGSQKIYKTGPGTLVLGAVNQFSGGIVISNGPNVQGNGAINFNNLAGAGPGPVVFANTGSITPLYFSSIGGSGTFSNNIQMGGATVTDRLSANSATNMIVELAGVISGGSATHILNFDSGSAGGQSRFRLSNAGNTFRVQHINLNRGGLIIDSDGVLGDSANTLRLDTTTQNPFTGLIFGNDLVLPANRTVFVNTGTRIDAQGFAVGFNGLITNNGVIYKGGAGTATYNTVISGTGQYQNDDGATVFNAVNTYTGVTTLVTGTLTLGISGAITNSGGLVLGTNTTFDATAPGGFGLGVGRFISGYGSVAGNVFADSGTRLIPGATNVAGTLTFSNDLVLSASATNLIDIGGNSASPLFNDRIVVNGSLTSGDSLIALNVSAPVTNGSYRVFDYAGAFNGSFTLAAPANSRRAFAVDTNTAGQINILVSGTNSTLRWSSTASTNWDVATSYNWFDTAGLTNDTFLQGDAVLFDDTEGVTTVVSLVSAIQAAGIDINTSTNAFTIQGPGKLTGGGSLYKGGTSMLTIASANDFQGDVVVAGGTLKAASGTALGGIVGATRVSAGATLDVAGQNLGGEPVFISGTGVGGAGALVNSGAQQQNALQFLTLTGDATVGAGATNRFDIRAGSPNTFLDLGGYTLTKIGAGQFSLVAAKVTNAGDIAVNEGWLSLETTSVIAGPGNVNINNGGTVHYWVSPTVTKTNVLNAGGTIICGSAGSVGAPLVLNGGVFAITNTLTWTGVVSGASALEKRGAGTLILSATNDLTGDLVISQGVLRIASDGALGAATSVVVKAITNSLQTRFELFGGVSVGTGVTLNMLSTGPGGAGGHPDGDTRSTLITTSGTNTWLGTINPIGSGLVNAQTEASLAVLNINGPVSNDTFTGTFFIRGGSGTTFLNSVVSLPLGNVRKTDGGTWWFMTNGHVWKETGVFVGQLRLGVPQAVPADTTLAMGQGDGNSPILDLGGFTQQVGRILFNSTGGTKTIGNSSATDDATLIVDGTNTSINGAVITNGLFGGTRLTRLVLRGGGIFSNSSANAYTGGTIIENHRFALVGADNRINTNTAVTLTTANGVLDLNGRVQALVGVTGPGVVTGVTGTLRMFIDQNLTNVLDSTLAGGIALVKVGSTNNGALGMLVLTGTNTFTGNVTVDAGMLVINNSKSLGEGVKNVTLTAGTAGRPTLTLDGQAAPIELGTNISFLTSNAAGTLTNRAGHNIINGRFALTGGGGDTRIISAADSLTINGAMTFDQANRNLVLGGPALGIINGVVSSLTTNPGCGLRKEDGGRWVLANDNDYPATTFVAAGVLQIGNGGTNGTVSTNTAYVSAGSTLVYNRSDIATNTALLSGTGTLVQAGSGTLLLDRVHPFLGSLIVSGGTLRVDGSIASTSVVVRSGATLAGNGTVLGPVVSDGTVAPGASAGRLIVGQTYTQAASGALAIEIGGTAQGTQYDWLVVSNSASLAGAMTVTLIDGFTPATSDIFVVLSASAISGTFDTTTLPGLPSGQGWYVDYQPAYVALSITSAPPVTSSGYDLAALVITNGLSGYGDDADGDGYANLLEYATGGNLTNADTTARMGGGRTNGLLTLNFLRATNATDVTLLVEGSYTATNDAAWVGIATNSAGLWGSATNVTESGIGSPVNVSVADTVAGATNRFLRLRVMRP